jgi:hypothetical protein
MKAKIAPHRVTFNGQSYRIEQLEEGKTGLLWWRRPYKKWTHIEGHYYGSGAESVHIKGGYHSKDQAFADLERLKQLAFTYTHGWVEVYRDDFLELVAKSFDDDPL